MCIVIHRATSSPAHKACKWMHFERGPHYNEQLTLGQVLYHLYTYNVFRSLLSTDNDYLHGM